MLWWKLPTQNQTLLAIYYAGVYVLYDTVATFVYMPYFALTPELTLDYDERTSLTTYRMMFSILGSLVAFTVPWMIIQAFRPENATRVWINGVVFAVLSALPLLVTFFGTRERPEFEAEAQPSLRTSLKAALRNRPFLFSAGIFLLTWATVDVLQASVALLCQVLAASGGPERHDLCGHLRHGPAGAALLGVGLAAYEQAPGLYRRDRLLGGGADRAGAGQSRSAACADPRAVLAGGHRRWRRRMCCPGPSSPMPSNGTNCRPASATRACSTAWSC